jgi:[histone H3]-dimethyl/trimethyl-L-lysine36 demethylase
LHREPPPPGAPAAAASAPGLFWLGAAADLAWELLHTGDWKDVPVCLRDCYSLAQLRRAHVSLVALGGSAAQQPLPPRSSSAEANNAATRATAAAGVLAGTGAASAAGASAAAAEVPEEGSSGGGLEASLTRCLRDLDLAALMGGPLFRPSVDALVDVLMPALAALRDMDAGGAGARGGAGSAAEGGGQPLTKRPRGRSSEGCTESEDGPSEDLWCGPESAVLATGPPWSPSLLSCLPAGSLTDPSRYLPSLACPSMESFLRECLLADRPMLITGAIGHWPAMTRWRRLSYLRRVAGARTVPVEVGVNYLAEHWGQRLMTLDDFLNVHVLDKEEIHEEGSGGGGGGGGRGAGMGGDGGAGSGAGTVVAEREQRRLGYLAQHALFDQIPALRRDIFTPDYCSLGEDGAPHTVNAWLGPRGTVTPLHYDPDHNLLGQVVGYKYVRLYRPEDSAVLQPYTEGLCTNSSQIDLDAYRGGAEGEAALAREQPAVAALRHWECVLSPGQMLYIPPKWWHYVRSLSPSFSVSFWWR